MSNYLEIPPAGALEQGEIVEACPVLVSDVDFSATPEDLDWGRALEDTTSLINADVIVLTQSCDLANDKAPYVTLCSVFDIEQARKNWLNDKLVPPAPDKEEAQWRDTLKGIHNDKQVSSVYLPTGLAHGNKIPARIAQFNPLFVLPRAFLWAFVQNEARPRYRLNSPFRERLSYRFAHLFGRIGVEDVDGLLA